jgi:hypothetical protein
MAIDEEVVIDSTSASNYGAWQNNVYGDGAEVIYFVNVFVQLDFVYE